VVEGAADAQVIVGIGRLIVHRVESSTFSINPVPKVGVGIRKIRLFGRLRLGETGLLQAAASGVGAARDGEQVFYSAVGAFGLGLPNWSKKNGNRASRVGPWR